MVPWPIGILTLFYGVIAAASAATAWKVVIGASQQPLSWPLLWLALSGGIVYGLPLLRAWARTLAIAGSALLMLSSLAVAGRIIMAGHPLAGLLATLGAGVHGIVIRYLTRPHVKAWFAAPTTTQDTKPKS